MDVSAQTSCAPLARASPSRDAPLSARYQAVRARTEALCEPLTPEDMVVQSMPDASPAKWHLAHTTWFFETFLLAPRERGFAPFHPGYGYLFNSYYDTVGPRHARPKRGLLTRPPLDEVRTYRREIDARVLALAEAGLDPDGEAVLELGLHHEQQHQELLLTDVKHAFSENPLRPAYAAPLAAPGRPAPPLAWVEHEGGLLEIGHGGAGFAFDNEGPRHRVWLEPFAIASRAVTCGEYLAFIEDGGYRRPELWLSDGFAAAVANGWGAPLYWQRAGGDRWTVFTLRGQRSLDPAEPVAHVSFYEADAYARWAGARLPSEAEWEVAAHGAVEDGAFADVGRYHPAVAGERRPAQLLGDVWEWTRSAYEPYPGFCPAPGALGEYNGKFMVNQLVLRGGSCATPAGHVRTTYRNFFYPEARWQFSGLRLCREAR
ncbi:MAG TPA: ergothioneine biosynthesis protein EgtB [Anaeromyxobacteraceae bacterium]|nr:ergothioneine biosynthesis protein EgtB [Anaeromyxobacteraceae bacterium]